MSLLNRLRDMLRAELHEATRDEPDPVTLMNRTIRDLEETLDTWRRETAQAIASCRVLEHKAEQVRRDVARRQTDAETAVRAGDDALAREALRRKLSLEETAAAFDRQLEEARALAEQLRADLALFEGRLAEARLNRDALITRMRTAELRQRLAEHASRLEGLAGDHPPADGDPLPGLLQSVVACEENLNRMNAATDALKTLLSDDPQQAFDRLRLEHGADDELAQLKATHAQTGAAKHPRRKGA